MMHYSIITSTTTTTNMRCVRLLDDQIDHAAQTLARKLLWMYSSMLA